MVTNTLHQPHSTTIGTNGMRCYLTTVSTTTNRTSCHLITSGTTTTTCTSNNHHSQLLNYHHHLPTTNQNYHAKRIETDWKWKKPLQNHPKIIVTMCSTYNPKPQWRWPWWPEKWSMNDEGGKFCDLLFW